MKTLFFTGLIIFSTHIWAQSNRPYKIIAYYTGNADSIRNYPVQQLSHIIYSFLKLQNDTLAFRDDAQRETVQKLVSLKKDFPQLKVMVSIGGWGGCASCSGLFASAEHRKRFAETAALLLKNNDIDGLDLDWEYPAIEGYPGHQYDTADRSAFTELVKALRKEMGGNLLLSFAAGGFVNYLEHSIDWNAVIPQVDFVNLMTYDLVGGYSMVTGHHTPLADEMPGQESARKCVNWLLDKKIPSGKLIIGAACYARVWENVPDTNQGLYQPGKFLRGVSFRDFNDYFCDSSGYCYYWDKKTKAPWQYNPSKKLFATFDDERSIQEKTKFIRRRKLGGMMFWQLVDDKTRDGMVDLISKGLRK